MTHWIIVLLVYYSGSDRVDIVPLKNVIFNNGIQCNEAKLSKEFQDHLIKEWKGLGVSYVKPFCKLVNFQDKRLADEKNVENLNDWPIEYLFNPTGPIDFTGEMKFEDENYKWH